MSKSNELAAAVSIAERTLCAAATRWPRRTVVARALYTYLMIIRPIKFGAAVFRHRLR